MEMSLMRQRTDVLPTDVRKAGAAIRLKLVSVIRFVIAARCVHVDGLIGRLDRRTRDDDKEKSVPVDPSSEEGGMDGDPGDLVRSPFILIESRRFTAKKKQA